jgi:GAF domain-containing protein
VGVNRHWRAYVLDRLERGDSPERIDRDLARVGGLNEDDRAGLWLLAWSEHQRRARRSSAPTTSASGLDADRRGADGSDAIVARLALARRETAMSVALLGEIRDGYEVVSALSGDARSFGLAVGASLPVEQTYCHLLLEGRLGNIVSDARSEALVRDLMLTRRANVGAYIGVPLTTLDARLYILCCLAHEQRPSLGERDVLLLQGLAQSIAAELTARGGGD